MFGVPNFHSGLFFGAATLIVFNTLTQSPAIFLAFFSGVVSSGLLTAGLLCWMAINGYVAVCMGLFDALQVAVSNHDLAPILLSIANIWNRRRQTDNSPGDILRGLNVHAARDHPLNGLRRARRGPLGNVGPQGWAPMGPDGGPQNPVGNQGPQGPQGPQGSPRVPMCAGNMGTLFPNGNMGTLFPDGNWGVQGDQGPQGHVPDIQAPREDVPQKNVRGPGDQGVARDSGTEKGLDQ